MVTQKEANKCNICVAGLHSPKSMSWVGNTAL